MTIKAIVFDAYGTLYDTQSVVKVTDAAFPGHGDFITQVWRMKQLEYTWLRSMMGQYEDFWTITKDALAYTIGLLGHRADAALFARIAEAYNTLDPYPDARSALQSLSGYRLAILSNGSPGMLQALVQHSGLAEFLEVTISVDDSKVFKPDPRAYELVEARLGMRPQEVLFVSSNGFDISGAKRFGFRAARIARVTQEALAHELAHSEKIGPAAMFKALRTQAEHLGVSPDYVLATLGELAGLAGGGFGAAT
jgi:2-haloacid dehalogenase